MAPIVALTLGLAACGGGTIGGDFVATNAVIGSDDSTQSRITAEIYAAALRGTGKTVTTDLAVGDRADTLRALGSGRVSLVPDHSGALIDYFQPDARFTFSPPADAPVPDPAAVTEETYRQLSSVLPEYLRVADPALAQHQSALAMTAENASRLQISTVAELGPQCATMTLGVEPGMLDQAMALRSLAEVDQCQFARVVQVGSAAEAREKLAANEIQVAGTFVGAPGMDDDGVIALSFPVGQLPAQNVIPLFRNGELTDDEIRALNKVAGELTTEDLQDMVGQVDAGGSQIGTVVGDWLAAHSF
ncbi:glycine betaine ABC transporter substrate-binding protein [Tomitella biformata]|uniref:glycine betaine ABC transporter substrate-binding protein n=1 Tax=Tomitella biformata TaxID=630403 RepID=UPI00130E1ACC|nr:glycine betaine ABC transporter substrate-binding protein [Tomitella biformata]